jgi:hypothetical protein
MRRTADAALIRMRNLKRREPAPARVIRSAVVRVRITCNRATTRLSLIGTQTIRTPRRVENSQLSNRRIHRSAVLRTPRTRLPKAAIRKSISRRRVPTHRVEPVQHNRTRHCSKHAHQHVAPHAPTHHQNRITPTPTIVKSTSQPSMTFPSILLRNRGGSANPHPCPKTRRDAMRRDESSATLSRRSASRAPQDR